MESEGRDWRNVREGREIPSQGYCDQPYVVKADDGAWLCVMTTGPGREGQAGQHVVTLRSRDRGRTWSTPVALEPAHGPEASYAVLLKAPTGRVFAFYNHNTDDVRRVKADNPPYRDGYNYRVDSLGHFVFRYSDDHGRTWSARRCDIPMREMAIDRENADGGRLKYFWNVGKAFLHEGAAYVSLHKVGGFGEGFFTRSEGTLLRSAGLLAEPDPAAAEWETLPEGDAGLRAPAGGGPVAEEQSYSVLSDGSLYAVYRTIDGHPACCYSRDGGRSWSAPRYERFASGRLVKHPRAANFAWRCRNGKYLYWFHNHGGRFLREHPRRRSVTYEDRNPVWLCGGEEIDGPEGRWIRWTEPEIALYDDDPFVRMSYPDLIEDGGSVFLTETQKDTARIHEVDGRFLEKLWGQFGNREVAREGLLLEWRGTGPAETVAPELPSLVTRDRERHDYGTRDLRAGVTVELWVRLQGLEPGQVLFDNRADRKGLSLASTRRGAVEVILDDGRTESRWDCDRGPLAAREQVHQVAVVIDGGPKVICFVVDGALCDGGEERQFGWGRYNPNLRDVNGSDTVRIGQGVAAVRVYDRALMTSELAGSYRAGAAAVGP